MNMKNILLCLIYLTTSIYLISCEQRSSNSEDTTQVEHIDSFESALPHGSSLGEIEMTDEDKLKLAKAVGKKAILISIDSLYKIIEGDSSGWCLYSFWSLDCKKCLAINRSLKFINSNSDNKSNLSVKYVNTVGLYPDQVNTYIRENEIVDDVYSIPTDTLENWGTKIDGTWSGELPAMLLINNNDGTRLFYQQDFSREELQAILETLTL